jgi:hypothetical protein
MKNIIAILFYFLGVLFAFEGSFQYEIWSVVWFILMLGTLNYNNILNWIKRKF